MKKNVDEIFNCMDKAASFASVGLNEKKLFDKAYSRILICGHDLSAAYKAACVYHAMPYCPAIDLIGSFEYGEISVMMNPTKKGRPLTDAEMQKYVLLRLGVRLSDIEIIINDRDNLDKYGHRLNRKKSPRSFLRKEMQCYTSQLNKKRARNQRILFCAGTPLNASLYFLIKEQNPELSIDMYYDFDGFAQNKFQKIDLCNGLLLKSDVVCACDAYKNLLQDVVFGIDWLPNGYNMSVLKRKFPVLVDGNSLRKRWQLWQLKRNAKSKRALIYYDIRALIFTWQLSLKMHYGLCSKCKNDYLDLVNPKDVSQVSYLLF